MFEDAMTSTFLQYETADFSNKISTTSHQLIWWLGTESNRVHWLFRPALSRRVPEPNLVDGARLELALHGCRPWVIPLYEPPIWGEMRESNSRNRSHNPAPKPFGQSRHKTSGAGRLNLTLVGEVQALCTPTVLDQQNS